MSAQNKSARIESRTTRNKKFRTETTKRDEGTLHVAATTDLTTHSTAVYIDQIDGSTVKLSGHTARTLYRLLQKHYEGVVSR